MSIISRIKWRLNHNRGHSEPHEIEADIIRAEISSSHRFASFADIRDQNFVKWHIDGHDYMWALSELLERAQECIFILDWWLSPELYLRRPPAHHPEFRLDRLLQRKAEQGVRTYIVVFQEPSRTMYTDSKHAKDYLESLHPNIAVMTHPDPGQPGSSSLFEAWSHNEKVVIVDNHFACIGGFDLRFGQWDTQDHPLADVHPTDFRKTLFPGQDYNNARVMGFKDVANYVSNSLNGLEVARMPCHDVHMTLSGPVLLDIVQHFVERWNLVKERKHRQDDRYPWLSFPHDIEASPNEAVARHPQYEFWHSVGYRYKHRWANTNTSASEDYYDECAYPLPSMETATCRVQALRSVSDWSHGVLKERSIQNAYIQLIREANHFIYIENQCFISYTQDGGQAENLIARAIVERVVRAAKEAEKFKVIILVPEMPALAGSIKDESSIKNVMAAQYRTINRGGRSIYEEVRQAGYEPMDYIRVYHLRGWDRINAPMGLIKQMEGNSGTSLHQAQVALAREWVGDGISDQRTVTLPLPPPKVENAETWLGLGIRDDGTKNPDAKKGQGKTVTVDLPSSVGEAGDIIGRFERGYRNNFADAKDSLSFHSNVVGQPAHSFGNPGVELRGKYEEYEQEELNSEPWLGSEEEERNAYVSEMRYIHSKLMIVDDRRVIMGSANINDRSQKGDEDSEMALVIEDSDMIDTYMNAQPYRAARFAATLRRKLTREHLGLIPPQHCLSAYDLVTTFMRPAPIPNADETGTRWDQMVADPLSEEFNRLWNDTARRNTEVFTELFRSGPTNLARDWKAWDNYLARDTKPGQVIPGIPVDRIKKQLGHVRGALIECPLEFLIDSKDFMHVSEWRNLFSASN